MYIGAPGLTAAGQLESQIEITGVEFKERSRDDRRVSFAWKVSLTNNSSEQVEASVIVSFRDASNFEVFSKIGSIILAPGQSGIITESGRRDIEEWDQVSTATANIGVAIAL